MALFQVYYGDFEGLQQDDFRTIPFHDGYGYFITGDQYFYVDYLDEDDNPRRRRVRTDVATGLSKLDPNNPSAHITIDDIVLKAEVIDVQHGGTGLRTIHENSVLVGKATVMDQIYNLQKERTAKIAGLQVKLIDREITQEEYEQKAQEIDDYYEPLLQDLTDNGEDPLDMKEITGTGVFMHLEGEEPKFGTVPVKHGGTGATTLDEARDAQHLDVYKRQEVNARVEVATTKAYEKTLRSNRWTGNDEDGYEQTIQLEDLRCGYNGRIPPIVTYATNLEEWVKYVETADATPGSGIVFRAKKQPEEDIDIIIIDNA